MHESVEWPEPTDAPIPVQVYKAVNGLRRTEKVLLLFSCGISLADFNSPDKVIPQEKYDKLAKLGECRNSYCPKPYSNTLGVPASDTSGRN